MTKPAAVNANQLSFSGVVGSRYTFQWRHMRDMAAQITRLFAQQQD